MMGPGRSAVACDAALIDRQRDRPRDLGARKPCGDSTMASLVDSIQPNSPVDQRPALLHQTGLLEETKVVCGRRSAELEFGGQARRPSGAQGKCRDDPASGRIREQFDPGWPVTFRHIDASMIGSASRAITA